MKRLLAALLLAGCAAEPAAPTEHHADAPTEEDAPPAAPACDEAETRKLQNALDGAHAAGTDIVMSVKTACGVRFFSSGPSKVSPNALHRIGSVTKTYVAGVVLSLVADGAISLDDRVSRFIDGVPNGDVITIRQLLTHKSGLFAYTDDEEFLSLMGPTHRFAPSDLLSYGTRHAPTFAPGAGWAYSNTNFVVLGLIAEAAGKAPIAELVRKRILDKLHLEETFFAGEESFGDHRLARGTDAAGADVTDYADISWAWAAGAIAATPSDVARWMEAVGSGAFHPPAIQKELLTPVTTDTVGETSGLGIFMFSPAVSVGLGIGHEGGLSGFNTMAFHFPAKKLTVVTISDSDSVDSTDAFLAAIDVLR